MLGLPRVFCPISLKWDLDNGKILFTSSFIKHEQFDLIIFFKSMSMRMGKGSNKVFIRRLWPKVKTPSVGFRIDVASSLRPQ